MSANSFVACRLSLLDKISRCILNDDMHSACTPTHSRQKTSPPLGPSLRSSSSITSSTCTRSLMSEGGEERKNDCIRSQGNGKHIEAEREKRHEGEAHKNIVSQNGTIAV